MAEDVKIFDGTNWKSLKGADGAEGPTVVSADAQNLAKLGTDGKLLVSQPDLDAIYVNVAGDKMTGPLAVQVGATFTPPATAISASTVLHVVRDGVAFIEAYSAGNAGTCGLILRKKYGTVAAPTPITAVNSMGVIRWQTKPSNGATDRTTAQIQLTATSPETEDGYFESQMSFTTTGYAAGQPSASLSLSSTAAAKRVGTLDIDTFVCAAKNFTVGGDGSVVSANGNFSVNTSGFITSKDGILVQRSRLGTAGQLDIQCRQRRNRVRCSSKMHRNKPNQWLRSGIV
jgi:hypothetical protein